MEPFFTTQSLTLPATPKFPAEGGGGVTSHSTLFAIFVTYNHRRYIFRYAYSERNQANSVLGNIRAGFGKPISPLADLANNYWRYYSAGDFRYSNRTNSNSYYIVRN